MRFHWAAVSALFALSVTTAACTSVNVTPRPSPTLAGCSGGPSQLESPSGAQRVAVAWPIGMRAFAPEVGLAVIDWTPGTLQEVLLVQVASAPAFTIQGHRCSDGHALRFSYRGLPPVTTSADGIRTPIPSIVMETEGEAIVPFDAYENTTPGSHFFTGYMLFTSAGDWLIETRDMDDKVLGTAVLRLRPAMVSAAPAPTASPASEIRSCGQVTAYAADGARLVRPARQLIPASERFALSTLQVAFLKPFPFKEEVERVEPNHRKLVLRRVEWRAVGGRRLSRTLCTTISPAFVFTCRRSRTRAAR